MSIHPLLLSISPPALEQQFWQQPHITSQLLNIDRFAFLVSTLNIYSGYNCARLLRSAPAVSAVMAGLCPLFLLLSVMQQLAMQRCPDWYVKNRERLLLATRIVRGGWMIIMMLLTHENDITTAFTARRLAAGVPAERVALQLLMLFTLNFLGNSSPAAAAAATVS
ncbi:hypothetical protein OEZ85_005039 [Tetradesmus obliquus]|uniref:Uncharacterized protein n=1 Tax=Tetradesmus obliquus TaxID=3088 RepID=A0ABY8UGM2_TETOB|nr:hypothetical protein OEZ85_005039 [Tetradesmus obliquus]